MSSSVVSEVANEIGIPLQRKAARLLFASATRAAVLVLSDLFALLVAIGIVLVIQQCISLPLIDSDAPGDLALTTTPNTVIVVVSTPLCILAAFTFAGRYSGRLPFWSELRIVFQTSVLGASLIALVALFLRDLIDFERVAITLLLFPLVATVFNRFARHAMARARFAGVNVVLVGNPAETAALEAALRSDALLGYAVARHLDLASLGSASAGTSLDAIIRQHGSQKVITTFDAGHELLLPLTQAARRERCALLHVPVATIIDGTAHAGASFLSHDIMLMRVHQGQSPPIGPFLKTCFDLAATVLLLLTLSPVFALICLMNAASGGPIFFAHRRLGRDGKPFHCLKFRTMHGDGDAVLARHLASNSRAAEEWASTRKLSYDPRITRVGHLLRKTSLDELPQLINVLMLDMSLVGPRPIVQSEVEFYGDKIAYYTAMRPGVTGLWQVSGRSNTSYARRVSLDVWYVRNWSFWSDIAVLLKTVPAVLRREGAH